MVTLEKSPEAFRTISEVAGELDIPQHVLRFWEGKFSQVKPMKRGGGRRYYRPQDIELLRGIRNLLYRDGYTIRGVQKILRDQGIQFVIATGAGQTPAMKPRQAGQSDADVRPVALSEEELVSAAQATGLSREHIRLLQATLYELTELKKLLSDPGE